MDPNNPIVKLCVAGMRAEGNGHYDEASQLFQQAWHARQDDFDACIAAHYIARHQPTPAATLHWNEVALTHANAVGDERVKHFYPSLYLNLAWSHEQLGDLVEAQRYYTLAAQCADGLPADRYGGVVQSGITNGQARIAQARAS